MQVASDTSPLSNLAVIDEVGLLQQIYLACLIFLISNNFIQAVFLNESLDLDPVLSDRVRQNELM